MVEFDRVFDGDDVHAALFVDDVEHRSERRRLTGARGTGNENKSAGLEKELLYDRRQPELLHGQKLVGNLAENRAVALALFEDGYTETRAVGMGEREVGAAVLLDFRHLIVVGDFAHEIVAVLLGERFLRKRQQFAVNAQFRRHERTDVKVASAFIDRRLKKFFHVDIHKSSLLDISFSRRRPS